MTELIIDDMTDDDNDGYLEYSDNGRMRVIDYMRFRLGELYNCNAPFANRRLNNLIDELLEWLGHIDMEHTKEIEEKDKKINELSDENVNLRTMLLDAQTKSKSPVHGFDGWWRRGITVNGNIIEEHWIKRNIING